MDRTGFFRVTAPTEWAGPPKAYSFSSLKKMGVCLRQWQLSRSRYGDLPVYPEPPSEPAFVGTIVHDLLNRLFRATALAGYPPLGGEAFLAVMKEVDVLGRARAALATFAESTATSLRVSRYRREATARDVYNHVAKAFREEYVRLLAEAPQLLPIPPQPVASAHPGEPRPEQVGAPADRLALLEQNGVLSEEKVRHPSLPLLGYIDLLVRHDSQTTVLDFKTGGSRPEYHEQLLLYALMWWRSTGDRPRRVELRFGARVEGWDVSESELVNAEERVGGRIGESSRGLAAGPAPATVGLHCGDCGYRQLCDAYWQTGTMDRAVRASVDRALDVVRSGAKNAFEGRDAAGADVTVVFDDDAGAAWGPFTVGERLRIIGAAREEDGTTLRIAPSTEVFRVVR